MNEISRSRRFRRARSEGTRSVAMGNSTSALAGVVERLMVEGDVSSDLADDAWEAILGGGDQPLMSSADVRAVFSDDVLRAARARKPKNLLAVMLRALERAEAALEPDAPKEGAPALGAIVASADAPTVLACVRLLARIVPFVAAATEEEEDPSDDSTNDEPADVRRFSRMLWGESEDAPLAPALPWRRHFALPPEERSSSAAEAEETRASRRRAETTRRRASGDEGERRASVGERLLALFCDLLFCPGFTTPPPEASSSRDAGDGASVPSNASWRESADPRAVSYPSTSAPERKRDVAIAASTSRARTSRRAGVSAQLRRTALALATRRREVLRLLLAMVASEAMYTPPRCVTRRRRFLEALGGGGVPGERASEREGDDDDRAATISPRRARNRLLRAGAPLRQRDVFRALVESMASTPGLDGLDGLDGHGVVCPALALARDEQRTAAVHCLLTLLDAERTPTAVLRTRERETATPSEKASARPGGALAATPSASWFRWLDDLFGALWGVPDPQSPSTSPAAAAAAAAARASNAPSFSLFGSLDWLGAAANVASPRDRSGSGAPAPTETRSRGTGGLTSSASEENAYGAALASFADHASLHDALLSIFRAAVARDGDRSGAGDAGAPCFEEAAALFLHAARANTRFFEFCVSERAQHGIPLVFHLLGLAVRHRGALDKGGFVQCASFAALRVSSSATFARALAATARDPAAHPELELFRDPSLDDPAPALTAVAIDAEDDSFGTAVRDTIASGVSFVGEGFDGLAKGLAGLAGLEAEDTSASSQTRRGWRGTHLDAFVYAAHALLTETSRTTSAAVANPLLVSVRNLVPFAGKNALSRGSCERLCRLVERYASRALLFAQPNAYEDHVRTLAEATHALDACARARGDDAALLASIHASRDVFERLDAMGAENDEADAEEARARDAEEGADSDDLDSDADVPFQETRRGRPSREWLRAIRSQLSLDATLRLARRAGAGDDGAEAATARFATVRRFTGASPEVRKWLRGYALGLVLLRETQAAEGEMSSAFAPLFDTKRVRLFRVTRVRRRNDS